MAKKIMSRVEGTRGIITGFHLHHRYHFHCHCSRWELLSWLATTNERFLIVAGNRDPLFISPIQFVRLYASHTKTIAFFHFFSVFFSSIFSLLSVLLVLSLLTRSLTGWLPS